MPTIGSQTNEALLDPNIQQRFADLGVSGAAQLAERVRQIHRQNIEKWTKVIKFAGIKPQ